MQARQLIERHAAQWQAATRHPFLAAIRDGTLPPAAFAAWLAQDYHYVGDLLVFQARLLARAPRPAQAALAAGLVGLEAELTWFEEQAARRDLDLTAPRLPATAAYREYLAELDAATYHVAITTLWAIEQAYLDAWRGAAPGHADYREFVEHWTTPAFAAYVAALEQAADAALAEVESQAAAERAFLEIARLERDFWEMAWREPVADSSA
jgi:thiaminase/transcriptional activator TenA